MRAGFEARVDTSGAGALDLFNRFVARAVRDVNAAAGGFRNHEDAMHCLDFREDRAGGDVVGKRLLAARAGFSTETVRDRRVFAVDDEKAVLLRDFAGALIELPVGHVLEVAGLAGTAGCDEGLEGGDAGVREGREVGEVPGDEAAHRGVVDPALAFGGLELDFKTRNIRRAGDLVEGHLDERGDAARSHGLRARAVAFPFGAAGLGEVHVRINHAGENVFAGSVDFLTGRLFDAVREANDHAVLHADVERLNGFGGNDLAIADDEIEHLLLSLH